MSSAEQPFTPTSDVDVKIYSGPGCMNCRLTKKAFERAGIAYSEMEAADHPEVLESARLAGGKRSLPIVVVTYPGSETTLWTGLEQEQIADTRNRIAALSS